MTAPFEPPPLRDWLRPTLDGIATQADARRLCHALVLGEGFKFHLVACTTARAAAALTLWLMDAVAAERAPPLAMSRLSPSPLDPRSAGPGPLSASMLADAVLSPLFASGQGTSERAIFIDATRATERDADAWRWLFARLNEQRNAIARRLAGTLVVVVPPRLEIEFARQAPDMWSIRGLAVTVWDVDEAVAPVALMQAFERRVSDPDELRMLETEVARLRREADRTGAPVLSRALRPLLLRLAKAAMHAGAIDEASQLVDEAIAVAARMQDQGALAACLLARTDILVLQGELSQALNMLVEQVLPSLQQSGDAWAIAKAWDRIADIYQRQGDVDEALRIRQEEQLPVYERLGDVRERAIARAKIADILRARGDLDEALRIYQRELLPVFERLGDVRAKAVTLDRVADILRARGDLDEALRISQEELLPVFERLGDVQARAITLGRVAGILHARGDLDEALRIRQEGQLPVFERLGDVHSLLVARANLALLLLARGAPADRDEARRLLHLALESATAMQLPESARIRAILQSHRL